MNKKDNALNIKNPLITTVHKLKVYTDMDKLNQYLQDKHIVSRGELTAFIGNSSRWWNGESLVMSEMFEGGDNQKMLSIRVIPKLINKGIIKTRSGKRFEVL